MNNRSRAFNYFIRQSLKYVNRNAQVPPAWTSFLPLCLEPNNNLRLEERPDGTRALISASEGTVRVSVLVIAGCSSLLLGLCGAYVAGIVDDFIFAVLSIFVIMSFLSHVAVVYVRKRRSPISGGDVLSMLKTGNRVLISGAMGRQWVEAGESICFFRRTLISKSALRVNRLMFDDVFIVDAGGMLKCRLVSFPRGVFNPHVAFVERMCTSVSVQLETAWTQAELVHEYPRELLWGRSSKQ